MRILVLQLKRIGDVILTTPLLAALREKQPGCEITVALDASTMALAPALDADRTLVFRRGAAGWDFWRKLGTGGFDVCLDLTGNDRSAFATALSHAPRRITWTRFAKKPLRRVVYNTFVDSSVRTRHTADHHIDLLRPLGIEVENVPLALKLPQVAEEEAAKALAGADTSGPFAVVHAGTARAEKYWQVERWAEVIEAVRDEHRMPVVLTGSHDATEQAHLEAIQNLLRKRCPSFAGQLSLLGTASVIKRATLLCAVDSAPVHLADAVGTPLVALFGPTNPYHWRPRRTSSHIVTASNVESLTPNYPKGPMLDIPANRVIDAVRHLLP
jgi:heptosyltransferase III